MQDSRLSCLGLSLDRKGVMADTESFSVNSVRAETSPPIEMSDESNSRSDKNLLI